MEFQMQHQIGNVRVSTIKLPLATVWGHMYETCVFNPQGSEVIMEYATEHEAIFGHMAAIQKIRFGR